MNPRSQVVVVVAAATGTSAIREKGLLPLSGQSKAASRPSSVRSLRKIGGRKIKGGREGERARGIISSNFQFCSEGKKRREGSASKHSGIREGG